MIKVTWHDKVTMRAPELRTIVEPLVEQCLEMLPNWCEELLVWWDSEDTITVARMETNYEYRWCKLWISPAFLTDGNRLGTVRHEFIHALRAPEKLFVDSLINFVQEKFPDTAKLLREQWRQANESSVCDETRVIQRLLKETM